MNNTMRVVAKAGEYEVIQDMNGLFSIHHGQAIYYCDGKSAYELIRDEVKDMAVRAELLKQWVADKTLLAYAEENSKEAEYRG